MDGTDQVQRWRTWLGLERKADLAVFVIALLTVGWLSGAAAFEAQATPATGFLAVAIVCVSASKWLNRGNDHLLRKRLGEIHQAFAQGHARRMSRAARVLAVLGFGLMLIHLWRALRG